MGKVSLMAALELICDLHPKIIATTNRAPARLPKNVTTQ
jgi:hypothetical protein